MSMILLYIGVALNIIGWLSLSYFAVKQIYAQKEYERLPQKWAEVKSGLLQKRWICRGLILLGIIILCISLLFD